MSGLAHERLSNIDERQRPATMPRDGGKRGYAGRCAKIARFRLKVLALAVGASYTRVRMAILFVFLLGIVNFAAHRAVLESGHPLVEAVPALFQALGGRMSLIVEFAMLLGAMWMVAAGATGWALAYLLYSLVNGLAAWLILSGRA